MRRTDSDRAAGDVKEGEPLTPIYTYLYIYLYLFSKYMRRTDSDRAAGHIKRVNDPNLYIYIYIYI